MISRFSHLWHRNTAVMIIELAGVARPFYRNMNKMR